MSTKSIFEIFQNTKKTLFGIFWKFFDSFWKNLFVRFLILS